MSELLARVTEKLSTSVEFLVDKPEEDVDSTARALILFASGEPVSARLASSKSLPENLSEQQLKKLDSIVAERLAGKPLSYITGKQHFMGLELDIDPGAVIPRVETEILAHAAIDELKKIRANQAGTLKVVDVCTGSGNLVFAIAHHIDDCEVVGTDISEKAVAVANHNVSEQAADKAIRFRVSDILSAWVNGEEATPVDMIVCNPPYISSGKVGNMAKEISQFEPREAFDGGPFGVSILFRLIQESTQVLRPGGWLAMEVGVGQGPGIEKKLKTSGKFDNIRCFNDDNDVIRVVMGQLQ